MKCQARGKSKVPARHVALFVLASLIAAIGSASPPSIVTVSGPLPRFEALGSGPNDFNWVRDRYGRTLAERARWDNLIRWGRQRAVDRTRQAQEAVRGFGVLLNRPDVDGCYGDEPCQWIIRTQNAAAGFETWGAFAAAWTEARGAATAYLFAVNEAVRQMRLTLPPSNPESEIRIRLAQDQMLRAALGDSGLGLSPSGQGLFRLIIGLHVSRIDRANTEWLRAIVNSSGWPGGPQTADSASRAAWVLVLHARDDPAFRLEVLRALQALVRDGRMSGADFATKFDHIMWETTGTQRYGTKGDCIGGRFVPARLEDDRRVTALRAEIGLPTLEEQAQMMAAACAP
jgi:hypothetical protein